jgi:Ser/Thr protein kinase RdoA (MazF antagonist)
VADDAGRLTIFDFDECCYSWYANDIAVALFALAIDAPDPPAFARSSCPLSSGLPQGL